MSSPIRSSAASGWEITGQAAKSLSLARGCRAYNHGLWFNETEDAA